MNVAPRRHTHRRTARAITDRLDRLIANLKASARLVTAVTGLVLALAALVAVLGRVAGVL